MLQTCNSNKHLADQCSLTHSARIQLSLGRRHTRQARRSAQLVRMTRTAMSKSSLSQPRALNLNSSASLLLLNTCTPVLQRVLHHTALDRHVILADEYQHTLHHAGCTLQAVCLIHRVICLQSDVAVQLIRRAPSVVSSSRQGTRG